MNDIWKIECSSHGMACPGCAQAAQNAISTARVTGSIAGSYAYLPQGHIARVTRQEEQ